METDASVAMQAQRDGAQQAVKANDNAAKAASAAQQSMQARMHHMDRQLAARAEELDSLRREMTLVATEAEEWRAKGVEAHGQLQGNARAAEDAKARVQVLERQAQQKDDAIAQLKRQLDTTLESKCASYMSRRA